MPSCAIPRYFSGLRRAGLMDSGYIKVFLLGLAVALIAGGILFPWLRAWKDRSHED